jgi:hypothetical protein
LRTIHLRSSRGLVTITKLATALGATVDEVSAEVAAVDRHVTAAGMSAARHHDEIRLVPLMPTADAAAAEPG